MFGWVYFDNVGLKAIINNIGGDYIEILLNNQI